MNCVFTLAGTTRDCKDNIGGVKEVYIVPASDVSAITVNGTTGIVTAITMVAGKLFSTYQLRKQKANFTPGVASVSMENGTTFFTNTVVFQFEKMNAAKRLELLNLAKGEFYVIVRDNNEKFWLMGYYNPVEMTEGGGDSGTAFGDANQFSVTLSDMGTQPAHEVVSTIISAVVDSNITNPPTPQIGNDITSFVVVGGTGAATINAGAHTVTAEVTNGVGLTSLTPTIGISAGARINPASGSTLNFTDPVIYTVTSQSGFSQAWTVTITEAAE